MATLHVVSHTHWDREWYRTFQQFRLRLVRLIEQLLEILEHDPTYSSFLLDGQAVILEDLADVRPDLVEPLARHVRDGRLHIGPWFVLPDEFLASPEALVRNLLLGDHICRAWGGKMAIGYTPDPFGHISQLPQLLQGFGIETAVFARGAGMAPAQFRWAAPDGSEVLVCYLRDHYDNAAYLPSDEDGVVQALAQARSSLAPHSATSHLLLMQGTDHLFPRADIPGLLAQADTRLTDRVLHSSLPAYIAAVRQELGDAGLERLPRREGQMRDPSRAHLLPGVLSTRMWIKQRNHRCQTLLERWAEPFGSLWEVQMGQAQRFAPLIRRAWRYLLENHPHDSICGCSVDQVHREMVTRFDWCEQIAEEVVQEALAALAAQVDMASNGLPGLVVFNPWPFPRSDQVVAAVIPPVEPEEVVLVGPDGQPIPFRVLRHTFDSEMEMTFDRELMRQVLSQAQATGGTVWGEWTVRGMQAWAGEEEVRLWVTVTRAGVPHTGGVPAESVEALQALLDDEAMRRFRVRIRENEALEVAFVARDLPALGYAGYRFVSRHEQEGEAAVALHGTSDPGYVIENEFLRVEADPQTGLLTVVDGATGLVLRGCNRFVDGGDRGDEYNYCPPEQDLLIDTPSQPPVVHRQADAVGQSLLVSTVYRVPEALDGHDRSARSARLVELPISVRIMLAPGLRRVDFETTVDNSARDHRLRVHFPTPLLVQGACAEGHWDVVEWALDLPADTADWPEQPVPTCPQRGWASVSDGRVGVTLANRGLPEIEVQRTAAGAEIALTLLRCVGWLSRDDLSCRRGHAGPALTVEGAQCLGRHTFRYALIPHSGDWRQGLVEASAFQTELRAVATASHPGPLPPALSFIRVEPPTLLLSAVKAPEQGQGLILRLWNAEERPVEGTVRLWRPLAQAVRVNLAERELEQVARDADVVRLQVPGRKVVTLRLIFPSAESAE